MNCMRFFRWIIIIIKNNKRRWIHKFRFRITTSKESGEILKWIIAFIPLSEEEEKDNNLLGVGLLFVSVQCVAAWHPNAVRFIVLQHDHFLPDHKPGWYLYDFGLCVSSQTAVSRNNIHEVKNKQHKCVEEWREKKNIK